MVPETRYARSGTINIAYQTVGDGPIDIVLVPGWVSNIDIFWEEPRLARFLHRLAAFSRLILFDKRGSGLSDRVTDTPTLEQRMDDVRAVMEAVGSEKAALVGYSEGGPMCALFAATYPAKARALVMIASYPRRFRTDDFPIGPSEAEMRSFIDQIEEKWGTAFALPDRAPSMMDDARFQQWWARLLRMSASPAAAQALTRANLEIDIRDILGSITVPTLLIHARGDRCMPIDFSRYMAERIANARLVEIDSQDHLPWLEGGNEVVGAIEQFLTGAHHAPPDNRRLCSILFTDIVGSTNVAMQQGDEAWNDLLVQHNRIVREELGVFGGKEIKTTGDGFLAVFDGPARAIQCAKSIGRAVLAVGLDLRFGLHTGECEFNAHELSGLAVHIASRILDLAQPQEILVSQTVRDLVAGSGLCFELTGSHQLKGIPDQWQLYRVV